MTFWPAQGTKRKTTCLSEEKVSSCVYCPHVVNTHRVILGVLCSFSMSVTQTGMLASFMGPLKALKKTGQILWMPQLHISPSILFDRFYMSQIKHTCMYHGPARCPPQHWCYVQRLLIVFYSFGTALEPSHNQHFTSLCVCVFLKKVVKATLFFNLFKIAIMCFSDGRLGSWENGELCNTPNRWEWLKYL